LMRSERPCPILSTGYCRLHPRLVREGRLGFPGAEEP
jgi:hypothetical protein